MNVTLPYVPVSKIEIFLIDFFHLTPVPLPRKSQESVIEEFSLDYWMQILSLIIALVGLVGNGLVLWLLSFRIKRNPFSIYILNLARADTLFLCDSFLFTILKLVHDLSILDLCLVLDVIKSMSYTMGLSLLATISTERCLSVLFPIWYRCHRSRHTSPVVCAVLWVLAVLVWLIFYILCAQETFENICYADTVIIFVWFLLLSSVLCVSSLALLLRVQCSSQRQQPPRLYLLVLLTVLIFLLCELLMGISGFILHFHKIPIPLWLPQLLACVNSSANPYIYFFLGSQRQRRGRESFRVVLQRALGDEQEVRGGERNTSLETSF